MLYTERLREACDKSLSCEIAALAMEEGLACLALVSDTVLLHKAKIESSVPRKRKASSQHDKAMQGYFSKCA
jgi:protein pelota